MEAWLSEGGKWIGCRYARCWGRRAAKGWQRGQVREVNRLACKIRTLSLLLEGAVELTMALCLCKHLHACPRHRGLTHQNSFAQVLKRWKSDDAATSHPTMLDTSAARQSSQKQSRNCICHMEGRKGSEEQLHPPTVPHSRRTSPTTWPATQRTLHCKRETRQRQTNKKLTATSLSPTNRDRHC